MIFKKKYIHILIVSMFVIYLISANYIFTNMLKVDNESSILDINVPDKNSSNIKYYIDEVKTTKIKWKDMVSISGWSFLTDQTNDQKETYIILYSDENKYIYDSQIVKRKELSNAFKQYEKLRLEESGFTSSIPLELLKNGTYQIGIICKNDNKQYSILTNQFITKENDLINISNGKKLLSTKQLNIKVPSESKNVQYYIDSLKVVKENGKQEVLEITGWSFVEGKPISKDTQKYIVLRSSDQHQIFNSKIIQRPDVTKIFAEGYNLDNSGFISRIPVKELPDGKYKLGIFLLDKSYEELSYASKTNIKDIYITVSNGKINQNN